MDTKNINELLELAKIEVNYRYGKTIAGPYMSKAQADQVLKAILPEASRIFGIKSFSLVGFHGYYIESNNGRESSGSEKTPKEAMAAAWTVMTSLREYVKNHA